MVTSANTQLLKMMCNQCDPCPRDLGVVKEGAYADLILADGNPLEDIHFIANSEEKFVGVGSARA